MNERDHASVSVLVGAKPHQSQFASGDERLQRVATAVDDFDCRQPYFSAIGSSTVRPSRTLATVASSDGRWLAGFLRLCLGGEDCRIGNGQDCKACGERKCFSKCQNPQ